MFDEIFKRERFENDRIDVALIVLVRDAHEEFFSKKKKTFVIVRFFSKKVSSKLTAMTTDISNWQCLRHRHTLTCATSTERIDFVFALVNLRDDEERMSLFLFDLAKSRTSGEEQCMLISSFT